MRFRYGRRYRKINLHRSSGLNLRIPYNLRILKVKLANSLFSAVLFGGIFLLILFPVMFIYYSRDLPTPDKVKRKEGFSTVILDRNNKPIYDIYQDKNRIPVPLTEIPDIMKKATISIEDKDFYKHQGFDTKGIIRAFFKIITFQGLQGGSTLTQQLVKNVLLSSERTLPRKFKEFILAAQIERKYSKDEILQMYLNEAPYGGTMWGIESAAQGYFGKSAKDLTPVESVILAGLPQRPSIYSPFGANSTAYVERSNEVLRRMREDGVINNTEEYDYKKALENVQFASSSSQLKALHFIEYVKKELSKKFGEKKLQSGGMKVITSLDIDLQIASEKIIREELDKLKGLNVTNGAAIVLDPQNGEVLAYIGSKEYQSEDEEFQGKFDVVSMGLRQPGSALKPITYAVAFNKGYTPSSLIMDVETHFPGGEGKPDYIPKNYDGKFRGPLQLRYTLGNSINVPAVKLTALVGVRDILKTAFDLGLTTLSPSADNEKKLGLSLTLGGGEVRLLELAQAYGVFANLGIRKDPVSILKVIDNDGKTIFEQQKTSGKKVLNEDVTFLVSHILADNEARKEVFGEKSYLLIPGKTVSVKTGTTDDKKDNWALGYTNSTVVGVWVGNNDNSPMNPKLASGVTGAAPIWNRIMREAIREKSNEELKMPANISQLTVDSYGGGLPYEGKPTRSEYFIRGTEPTAVSAIYKKIKISKKDSQKSANNIEIAQGEYEEKEFIVFSENDPTSDGSENRWQEAIDDWLSKQGDPVFHPPKEESDQSADQVYVQIKKPQDNTQLDEISVEIIAVASAINKINKIELYIDGSLKNTYNQASINEKMDLTAGIHKIKIKAYDEENRSGEREITIGVKVSPLAPTATVIPTVTSFLPSPTP